MILIPSLVWLRFLRVALMTTTWMLYVFAYFPRAQKSGNARQRARRNLGWVIGCPFLCSCVFNHFLKWIKIWKISYWTEMTGSSSLMILLLKFEGVIIYHCTSYLSNCQHVMLQWACFRLQVKLILFIRNVGNKHIVCNGTSFSCGCLNSLGGRRSSRICFFILWTHARQLVSELMQGIGSFHMTSLNSN